jgi:GNAT superfamily N-acetyltransferase
MQVNEERVLRPAIAADAEAVARIWREGWRDGHLGHVPVALVEVRTPESFSRRAADRVADTTVVAVDGDIAGFTMVTGDEVEQIYVSRSHRGSGIAAQLLADARRRIGDAGHQVAWLAVATGNGRARRFYERCGWADEGAFDYPASTDSGSTPVPCHRYTARTQRLSR